LSTPGFLTTAFAVGQPGEDADLEALFAQGAIDTNGQPDPAAVSLIAATGAAQPLAISPATGASGTGGTGVGGAGSTGGMM
jgi:hypothetical protein